jgi:hypothetical protein
MIIIIFTIKEFFVDIFTFIEMLILIFFYRFIQNFYKLLAFYIQ